MNSTFNCLIFTGKTRFYAPREWKLLKAWKYVEESKPSLTILNKVENSWKTKNRENRFGFEGWTSKENKNLNKMWHVCNCQRAAAYNTR
jgi:hypothetical protein